MLEVHIVKGSDGLHRPSIVWEEHRPAAMLPPECDYLGAAQRKVTIVTTHHKASEAVREAAAWLAEHGL